MDKVPISQADGSHDPKCLFKCVACENVFHGDCAGLSKGEKKLAQKTSGISVSTAKCSALCALCAQTSKVVWNAATRDASMVTLVLATLAAKMHKKGELIELAKKYAMEDMAAELLEFSVRFHNKDGEDSPEEKIEKLRDATAEILLARVPDASLFGEDLVAVFQRAASKRAEGVPTTEDDAVMPSPLKVASEHVSTALALAAHKRSLIPEDDEDDGAAGGRPKGRHDPAISCPGCNLPGKTWATSGCFYRHLRAAKECADNKWPEENTPMDGTVTLNLRAGFQVGVKGRTKKVGRSSDPAPPSLDPCSYCGEIEKEGDQLLKCITYHEEIETPLKVSWWSEQKEKLCSKTLHLSCARSLMESTYNGPVPIANAGTNMIGFCKECFPRMEAARKEEA
jgi:hypothetical protein